jgi:hypothetical protein
MSFAVAPGLSLHTRIDALEEDDMTATYTFDAFSSLDGCGAASGSWTGYLGKQGPELVENQTLDGNIQQLIYRPTLHV